MEYVIFLGLGYILLVGLYDCAKSFGERLEQQKASTFADCDASQKLSDWIEGHPGCWPGKYVEGRKIVEECIATWKAFLMYHSFTDGVHRFEWLQSLLDCGDEPPEKEGPTERKGLCFIKSQLY